MGAAFKTFVNGACVSKDVDMELRSGDLLVRRLPFSVNLPLFPPPGCPLIDVGLAHRDLIDSGLQDPAESKYASEHYRRSFEASHGCRDNRLKRKQRKDQEDERT